MRYVFVCLVVLATACQPVPPASTVQVARDRPFSQADWATVRDPQTFVFPADEGAHQDYQTEWWYYTGNLRDAAGNDWGYQWTLFRRGLTPTLTERPSTWATANSYFAHLGVTDGASQMFWSDQRFSRDGAELAGVTADPFRAWIEDWSLTAISPTQRHLVATTNGVTLDLVLEQQSDPITHQPNGIAPKGPTPGNATYYYSVPHWATTGTITTPTKTVTVTGTSWYDREWGTWTMEPPAVGWDWFALHLADGRDLMLGRIRDAAGTTTQIYGGTLRTSDGTTRPLTAPVFTSTRSWQSPQTGVRYPVAWEITTTEPNGTLTVAPLVDAQEHATLAVQYWEGAVMVTGTLDGQAVSGVGYAELTGYAGPFLP